MKTFLNAIMVFVFCNSFAQNTISGIVVDTETTQALPFVNIYIPELESGTTTNENGEFQLINIPTGTYRVVYSYLGYETKSESIKTPLSNPLNIASII